MTAKLFSSILLLAVSSCLIQSALAGSSEYQCQPLVVPIDEVVYNNTYGDWAAEWWKYILGLPQCANPAFDSTGHYCNVAQDGPVFFLAGSFTSFNATRQCTIKGSKYIFFPILNVECSSIEAPPFYGATACDRRYCANVFTDAMNATSLRVRVDNNWIRYPRNYRTQSSDFLFTIPPNDNALGVEGATWGYATAAGYYIMLRPLSVGWHQIYFEGCLTDRSFCQYITYNLNVIA